MRKILGERIEKNKTTKEMVVMNNNIPENKNKYKNNCRKVYADYYIDDRNKMIVARRRRKKCGPLNRTNVLNYMMKKRTK